MSVSTCSNETYACQFILLTRRPYVGMAQAAPDGNAASTLFTSRFHVVLHWEHQRTPWISRCLRVFGRFPGSRALPGSILSECSVPASAAAKAHLLHRCEVKCSWRMMTRVWNSSRCRSCMMGPGKYPKPEEHRHAPKTTTASMPFPPVMR